MIWNIDPVLLNLGPLELRYYGLLFAGSLLAAYFVAHKMAKTRKLNLEKLDELLVFLIIGLILGARFGHIVFYELDYYLSNPGQIFAVWNGGLASHGAAIGVLVAFLLFMWRNPKLKLLQFADIIAVVAAFPIGLVRLGNFFNSEIVGRPWDGAWAVTFPRVDMISRHPSQLYEFTIGVALFTLLYPLWNKKHKSLPEGFFVGLLMSLYFSMRFTVEFFKEYPLHEGFFNLTTGQILSIPFVLLGLGVMAFSWKRYK